jgi:hypothetical protein
MSMTSEHMDLTGILAAVNGEPAGTQAATHLAACADCQAEARGWAAVADGVGFLAASLRVPAGAIPAAAPGAPDPRRQPPSGPPGRRQAARRRADRHRPAWRTPGAVAAAAVVAVAAAVLAVALPGHSALTRPLQTTWQAARALPAGAVGGTRGAGDGWRLASYLITGWQRSTEAVSGGFLTCPATGICYVIGDSTTSSSGTPDFNALYVSADGGIGWSAVAVPSGLSFTTALSCGTATACAAGGDYLGQPVFVRTANGGHSWTVDPLPAAARGVIVQISCPTAEACGALLATAVTPGGEFLPGWLNYGGVTFLRTADAGRRLVVSRFPAGQVMQALDCPSAAGCVAVGVPRGNAGFNRPVARGGFVDVTADGGATWAPGQLPAGFGLGVFPQLTCPDAGHCFLTGSTNQNVNNAFAATADGGRSWRQLRLPRDIPQPDLSDVACPTDVTCYAAGSDAIEQRFANGSVNGGSALMLATSNGGASWSRVSFAVPAKVPAGWDTDAYMDIGIIQCPRAGTCVALGTTDQGSRSTPVYTLGSTP